MYPYVVETDVAADVVPPTILFFDLDKNLTNVFPTNKDFENASISTRNKIKQVLRVDPTLVLWTGGGIHFYHVIRTAPIQRLDIQIMKMCSELNTQASKEFLRFSEQYFTGEKCDPKHGPSIRSCLGRIPYTLNSKYEVVGTSEGNRMIEEVIVITNNLNNKDVSTINVNLVKEFKYYLSDMKVKMILRREEEDRKQKLFKLQFSASKGKFSSGNQEGNNERYTYIEKVIISNIDKNRYFVIWTLLGPYYRKIQGLSYEESEKRLFEWLQKCNEIEPVKNMKTKVYSALARAHEFSPWGIERIEEENIKAKGMYDNILEIIK